MHNLDFEVCNSQAHRGFPGSFESTNLSRDNLSREDWAYPELGGGHGGSYPYLRTWTVS